MTSALLRPSQPSFLRHFVRTLDNIVDSVDAADTVGLSADDLELMFDGVEYALHLSSLAHQLLTRSLREAQSPSVIPGLAELAVRTGRCCR